MLQGDDFIKRVVPSLSRLFASSDRNLRRNLLEAVETFGPHLTQVRQHGIASWHVCVGQPTEALEGCVALNFSEACGFYGWTIEFGNVSSVIHCLSKVVELHQCEGAWHHS